MLDVEYTTQFKRDLKLAKRRNNKLALLQKAMDEITHQKQLDPKYKDHLLTGNWHGCRELHIQPDWLLIYQLISKKTVIFIRTGSHADLFD